MNLNLDSPVPPEIKKFWASSVNKETPCNYCRNSFFYRSKRSTKKYYSNWLRYRYGSFDGLEMINDEINQRADLNCTEEEADSRLIFHVANARAEGCQTFLVFSNDSDFVAYHSIYFDQF